MLIISDRFVQYLTSVLYFEVVYLDYFSMVFLKAVSLILVIEDIFQFSKLRLYFDGVSLDAGVVMYLLVLYCS